MKHYKILHKDTETVMLYVESESAPDDVCAILGSEYGAEEISKEEYEAAEADDVGGDK